jgi:hypothetical protein
MSRDMLSFVLADDTRVTVRPSGTEPKLKLYVETTHESVDDPEEAREELMTRAHALVNTVILTMMNRIDVVLPPWALDISDRVNLDTKIEWSNRLVPALLEQLELAPDTAGAWLRARLDADERALLRPGIESLIKGLGFDHPTLWACFTEPVSAVSHPGD